MKVLHVITGLGSGGAERMLTRIGGTRLPGVEQLVVSLMDDGFFGEQLRASGLEVICLRLERGRVDPLAVVRLAGVLRRERPDVVMTWLYHADLLTTLAAIASGFPTARIVWNIRCSEMELKHYSAKTRLVLGILKRLSTLPGAIVSNSKSGLNDHIRIGYRPRRTAILPNGFDMDLWRPDASDRQYMRASLGLRSSDLVVGHIARVDAMKGHPVLLRAAQDLARIEPRLKIVLVGNGTKELQIPLNLREHFIVLGERLDVPRLMRTFDLLCMSSLFGEGFPNVLGEAMATGVPCVATDVGDSQEIVRDAGRIVTAGDPVALTGAIRDFFTLSVDEREVLQHRAREIVATHYSLEAVSLAYFELWRSMSERF